MFRTLFQRSVLALIATTLACGGGNGDIIGASPSVVVSFTVDSQLTLLGTDITYQATFLSVGGFSGEVDFSVDSLPVGWTVNTGGSNLVMLSAGGTRTRSIDIVVATDADPAPAGHTLILHAVAASHDNLTPFKLTVVNEFIMRIELGTVAGPHWGSYLNQVLNLRVGSTLTFQNEDSVSHTIHANATIPGLAHEPDPGMAPLGGTYSSTITGTGDDDLYCHSHGDSDDKFHVHVGS